MLTELERFQVLQSALGMMGDRETELGPRPLTGALRSAATMADLDLSTSDTKKLLSELVSNNANQPCRLRIGEFLRRWDYHSQPRWGAETRSNTDERRTRIY